MGAITVPRLTPPGFRPIRMITPDVDDSLPLRELERLAGGRCSACDRPYTAREAVSSVALGFKNAPRCLPCLADGLRRTPADLRADLIAHVRRRECYARAWAAAERTDGPSTDWPVITPPGEPSPHPSPDPTTEGAPAATWDAGDMGCGELVMALRGRLNGLPPGAVLKVVAVDPAATEDLPAWCRMTGNPLVRASHPEYFIRRKGG